MGVCLSCNVVIINVNFKNKAKFATTFNKFMRASPYASVTIINTKPHHQ